MDDGEMQKSFIGIVTTAGENTYGFIHRPKLL